MNSNDFLNYINNSKNLLSSYNGDWNKIFRERGIKNRIEKSSTFKSNSSNHKKESEKEMDASNINNNKQIEDLLILLNQQSNIQKDIEENLKENENLKQIINNKENEIICLIWIF